MKKNCLLSDLEGDIYRNIRELLSDPKNQQEIREQFPDSGLKRRNNGYALDILLNTLPFIQSNNLFNFSKLIAGSEGTLAFITECKLNLEPLPPKEKGVICVHLDSIEEALHANLIALPCKPGAIELMDRTILNLAKGNISQKRNSFFIIGDPGALLIVEFSRETQQELQETCEKLIKSLKVAGFGYHFPILIGNDMNKVWALRKSGLGVLSNIPGDAKPVSVIEDTAVLPELMPEYIREFNEILVRFNLQCVYHAHIGSGELHLRPILNLKESNDVELFRTIAIETAKLVKKYRGSLSGEHGDGRLRGEFIPLMIGNHNYELIKKIKFTWDPNNIFNAGKIIDTPPMNTSLRYIPGQIVPEIKTFFDFSSTQGIIRAVESCNGSGDCRKSFKIGGVMCPSYMATRNEYNTTRARANILREFLSLTPQKNPFNHKEIYKVLDLCLSCKGCKSECPSNVDMAKLKAEFLQHYYDSHWIPIRTLAIAYISEINKWSSFMPTFYNFINYNKITSFLFQKSLGFSTKRKFPILSPIRFSAWLDKNLNELNGSLKNKERKIYFFVDEFTEFNDTTIGIAAIKLLNKLGYFIEVPNHIESGRTFISKGLLRKAKKIANTNVQLLKDIINDKSPLVGIEPSCILTFRDEYPDLVDNHLRDEAKALGNNSLLIDDFLALEFEKGNIAISEFTSERKIIKFHGHCQQKALLTSIGSKKMLSIPANYKVIEVNSGCCGMAGSFGYEKEHYDLSMQIGELILFPEIRNSSENEILAATGTSCRHHIYDGTGKKALHPIEILYKALN